MYEKKYDGFFFGIVIFTLSMFIASILPFFTRLIVSFFIKTPTIVELHADASYLFNVVYPAMGAVTIISFIIAGYLTSYIAGYKIAYKARIVQPEKKVKTQTVLSGTIIYIINMYMGTGTHFCGIFASQFWYPSALTASVFGVVNKHNVLKEIAQDDIRVNNFVITGINDKLAAFIIVYSLLITAAFIYCSYRGRRAGEAYGLENVQKYIETVKNSDSTIR
ncbi:MAG TPA: hypothetical protein DD733_08255 [Clostridiales bacterium]|nr:hypothetical protein [Eubacteriales bacterium]HBR32062.1 hypothetical protein [Clostridiales bacterium]